MILTAVFQMMSTGEIWNPTDLFKVDMPESLIERQLSKAVKQATKFLEKQGLTVSYFLWAVSRLAKNDLLQGFFVMPLFSVGIVTFTQYSLYIILYFSKIHKLFCLFYQFMI